MKSLILSHVFDVLNQESFPVIGTPHTALIFALLFSAMVLTLYVFIDHLPKPKKNLITLKAESIYAKIGITLVTIAALAGGWDVWWHREVGRDNFFIFPHLLLYSCIIAGTVLSFYVWRHSRDFVWKHVTFVLMLIPVAGAFDNYFHTLFGVERLDSPVRLAWSPGHIWISLTGVVALILFLKILIKNRKTEDFSFFGNLGFAGITVPLMFLVLPFHPTDGWGQVAGFAGAGVLALTFIAIALTAEKTMKGRIDATLMTVFTVIVMAVGYGKEIAPGVVVLPHDRPPVWLSIFAFLTTAILLDLTKDRFPMWLRGLFAGVVWSGILFGFSTNFFAPQFQYGMTEIFSAVTFSAMGGLVAGSIFGLFHLDDEKHIEKHLKKW